MDNASKQERQREFDFNQPSEMARLINQDRLTTRAMGGPLPEQADRSQLQQVLDLGCGPGGWVLDLAYELPKVEIAGIDSSPIMIEYANARARSQGLNNASFQVMDIRKPLDFADQSFDLVNARFLVAAIPRREWPAFLLECRRVLRPGGIIRLTEPDTPGGLTNSLAFEQLSYFCTRILQLAGYGFSPDGRTLGMSVVLERLLQDAGFEQTQSRAHAINFSAGMPAHMDLYHNSELIFQGRDARMMQLGGTTPEELDSWYTQMQLDLHADTFCGIWSFLTAWGSLPA